MLPQTLHKTIEVGGLEIFYRESGSKDAPTILLLHGFPTSSHMFRNLIPALADRFHVVAPDYPGFGNSSMPAIDEFDYSFDHISEVVDNFIEKLGLKKYTLYLFDYGAPVGPFNQAPTLQNIEITTYGHLGHTQDFTECAAARSKLLTENS